MMCTKCCITLAVLLAATLSGWSGDDKRVGKPKWEITATREGDGIRFHFVFPVGEGDTEFSGLSLVDWGKKDGPPGDAIRIPLRATLKEKDGKRAYVDSFRVTKQLVDQLGLEIQYVGGKGIILPLADIPVKAAKGGGDAKTLQGKWAGKGGGTRITIDFDKGNFVLTFAEPTAAFAKGTFKGTFKLNTTVKPHQLDLNITEAPDNKYKSKTALAIVSFESYGLLLCATEPGGGTRPTDFTGKGGLLHAEFGRAK